MKKRDRECERDRGLLTQGVALVGRASVEINIEGKGHWRRGVGRRSSGRAEVLSAMGGEDLTMMYRIGLGGCRWPWERMSCLGKGIWAMEIGCSGYGRGRVRP